MPGGLIGYIIIAAQIYCVFHALKNRKPWWWIPIIIIFPFIGCLWYFFREMGSGGGGRYAQMGRANLVNRNPSKPAASTRMVRQLEEQLEYSDTVDTRTQIAEACYELGDYEKSIEYYRSCLKGIHADDGPLLYSLAQALMANGNSAECIETLEHLTAEGKTDYANERLLLEAIARDAEGQTAEALALYDKIHNRLSGEEARCRYALLLQKVGEDDKARKLFEQILENAEHGDSGYKSRNSEWIKAARSASR